MSKARWQDYRALPRLEAGTVVSMVESQLCWNSMGIFILAGADESKTGETGHSGPAGCIREFGIASES